MFANIKLQKENKRTSETRIGQFLDKTALKLPEDYRRFLLDCNGIYPQDYHCFFIPEIKQGAVVKVLYGMDLAVQSDCLNLNYNYNFNFDIPPEYLMIGSCYGEGGLFIMLSTAEETAGIYVCDLFYDEFVFAESTEDHNVYKLADTFTGFMENLQYVDIAAKRGAYFPQHDFTFILPEDFT